MLRPSRSRVLLSCLAVLVAGLGVAGVAAPAHAADRTWNGSEGNGWSDPSNWDFYVFPVNGDSLYFADSPRKNVINDLPGTTMLSAITVSAPGYSIGGYSMSVGTLNALTSVTFNTGLTGGDRTVNASAGATVDLRGSVSGPGGLTVAGAGQVRLSAPNSYSGSTTVSGGTLIVDSGISSPVTVQANATLAGQGMTTGAVAVRDGGTLSPGPAGGGPAAFLAVGAVSLESGATYRVDIDGTANHDRIRLSGTFVAAGATLDVDLGYTPAEGDSVEIVTGAGTIVGHFAGLPEGSSFVEDGTTFEISYAGGAVTLTAIERPTSIITLADTDLRAGETTTVTTIFSEPVTGFTLDDLTVANGTLDHLSSSDGGTIWSATLTPDPGVDDATNVITLDNTRVEDLAGNTGTGTTTSTNYAVRTVRPTAGITISDTALKIGDTALVTFTFSEAVTGFTAADVTVPNGTLDTLSSSNGGVTWTATLTPAAGVEDTTNVITLHNTGVGNSAGNAGTGTTTSDNYAVDTVRPELVADIELSDRQLDAGDTSEVKLTFNESVADLSTSDLTTPNASLASLASSDGGRIWTATLTPDAATRDATNVLTLDQTGVTDLAGNAGVGTIQSGNYTVDTVRPTATISVWDDQLGAYDVSMVVIEFDEAVTDLTHDDIDVPNATLGTLTTTDGGRTWRAPLTPASSTEDATNIITLDLTGVRGPSGNAGTGTATSTNYEVDTVGPTADLAVTDTDLRAGETTTATIIFSEAVVGFDNDDLDVPNGTLSPVTTADGGRTWTATLTPALGVSVGTNVITLDLTDVGDTVGNPGVGTATSNAYAVDTVVVVPDRTAPTSAADGPELSQTRTWTITYTASDADSGVASVDLYVRAPGASAYRKVDTGTAPTGELTYTADVDGAHAFRTIATDRAGNVEEPPAAPDVTTLVDTTAPESRATGPRLVGSRTWSVGYAAADDGSGVTSVDLWVRAPGETAYTKVDTATDPEGELTYTAGVDGTYDFHTVATDGAGNVEDVPATPDVSTLVDTRAPSVKALGATPWVLDLGSGALRMRFRVDEDADVSVRILQRRDPVRAYRTRSVAAGVLAVRWAGRDDGGVRVQPGRYRVVAVVIDAAGNRTQESVVLRVRR